MITGTVTDFSTGQPIPGANVFISDPAGNLTSEAAGTTTNSAGNYSLNHRKALKSGATFISASYVGYEVKTWLEPSAGNGTINFRLQPGANNLQGVTVTAAKVKNSKKALVIFGLIAAFTVIWYISKRKAIFA